MAELNERDLHKLFQAAGHHAPDSDLAARIMARVAVTPIHRPAPAKPLIGLRGWILIAVVLALPLLAALLAGPSEAAPATGPLASLWEQLSHLQLPAGQWSIWLIGASLVALLLVAMDHYLGRHSAHKTSH
jgi:hypothetical protein